MKYKIDIRPRAYKDLKKIDRHHAQHIIEKIAMLENDLAGNIKRLSESEFEYRLRVGDFCILFDIESDVISIRRIKNRREAYR